VHDISDERVLVLMPTIADGERMERALAGAAMVCTVCRDLHDLCQQIVRGGGVALLTEEVFDADRNGLLLASLAQQPPWSDFPLLILAREGFEMRRTTIRESVNATLVERPVRIRSLVSVVRAALRSRRHQYSVRAYLDERREVADTLRAKEERLRFALEAGRLGSWELDLSTGHLESSDIFRAIFGRLSDVEFTYEELFGAVVHEDRDRMRDAVSQALRNRTDLDAECRCIWPDQSVHWVMIRGRAVYRDDGLPIRVGGGVPGYDRA
jgi:PAS domain-containing protein